MTRNHMKYSMSPAWYAYFHRRSTWRKAGVGLILVMLLLAALPVLITVVENTVTSRAYYFDYLEVHPAKNSFAIGQKLVFVTSAVIHKRVNLVWHDILYCDLHDGLGNRLYSIYESSRDQVAPRTAIAKPWVYHSPVPHTPAVCYLQSTITVNLPYASKTQHITGKPFRITKVIDYGQYAN